MPLSEADEVRFRLAMDPKRAIISKDGKRCYVLVQGHLIRFECEYKGKKFGDLTDEEIEEFLVKKLGK